MNQLHLVEFDLIIERIDSKNTCSFFDEVNDVKEFELGSLFVDKKRDAIVFK
jgi:hypothetical protein